MKKINDEAIVLKRVNYGEKDRILNVITMNNGRQALFAKSVRASKSRLAGGVELMTVSNISFIDTNKDIKKLISADMKIYFEDIIKDMKRLDLAFVGLKLIDKITVETAESYHYVSLKTFLIYLNKPQFNSKVVDIWFGLHVLFLAGLLSELLAVGEGNNKYSFDYEKQIFISDSNGSLEENDIKFMRLLAKNSTPINFENLPANIEVIQNIKNHLVSFGFD